ncbi:MAG: T9SS type A sorting domain-containing protein [Actinobacteria bacterium]|nr:T9SS type A sorting domain-containing protein [Actinomycetota bacterium]
MKAKIILSMLVVLLMASFAFSGVTEMRIWCDEMMNPDPGQINDLGNPTRFGTKSDPATFYVIRWCVNKERCDYMKITGNDPEPAAGPYCVDFVMNQIPGPNLWMDMRRNDAAPGWDVPLDASATERVTFWIKAPEGTPPLWFYVLDKEDANFGGGKEHSTTVRIEGETFIAQDEFGEFYTQRLTTFNDTWQFVSIPWTFLEEKDQAVVTATVPYSYVMEGTQSDVTPNGENSFHTSELRTLTWASYPTDDGGAMNTIWMADYATSPDCKWDANYATVKKDHQRYSIDEVIFCLNDGTGITDVDGNPTVVPASYELGDAYPNPFNPTTEIEYAIPVSNNVSLAVFNSLGQKIKTLVDRHMTAGTYHATWDGTNDMGNSVPSGVYFYKITSSHFNASKRMTLLK